MSLSYSRIFHLDAHDMCQHYGGGKPGKAQRKNRCYTHGAVTYLEVVGVWVEVGTDGYEALTGTVPQIQGDLQIQGDPSP